MKNLASLPPGKISYNDFKIRIVASVLAAHIVTEYGGNTPWLPRLLTKQYYIEFGSSLIITLLLVECIYRITCWLDGKYSWSTQLPQRIVSQIILGIVCPTMGAFLLAATYFGVQGYNILNTNYHLYALPFIASLIALFNVYYYVRFLLAERSYYRSLKATHVPAQPFALEEQREEMQAGPVLEKKEVFIVNTPLRSIPMRLQDICAFYRANGFYYVRGYDHSILDAHVIPQTLKEIEDQVDPAQFFRINRQMIVSFNSCVSYRSGNGKTLELIVSPPYVDVEKGMRELPFVTVSEDRSAAFKAWIDR